MIRLIGFLSRRSQKEGRNPLPFLTPQEARYARSILLRWRNKLLNAGKPTEDVEELILRLAR